MFFSTHFHAPFKGGGSQMNRNTRMCHHTSATTTAHAVIPQDSEIVQAYDAWGMTQRFRFTPAEETLNRNAQVVALFPKVNVRKGRVLKRLLRIMRITTLSVHFGGTNRKSSKMITPAFACSNKSKSVRAHWIFPQEVTLLQF